MQTTPETDSTPAPRERPLFSAGKKIVFIGALLVWGGFFLPWFSSVTVPGIQLVKLHDGYFLPGNISIESAVKTAGTPSGAEIPFCLGWIILGMAFLAVILPDAFPEFGLRWLKRLSLCALVLGAAALAFLLFKNPTGIKAGVPCIIAGYALLLIGVLMDFAASAPSTSPR